MRYASISAALLAAIALAACSHTRTTSSSTTTTTVQASASAPPAATTAPATMPAANPPASPASAAASNGAMASDGATVYATNCSSCHQASGLGVPGTFPPLAHNPVVTGAAAGVIHIVKDGLTGAITVKGVGYNGQMPSWGQTLSNADIAAVITYIRSSWGNSASAVTPAQVTATQ